MYVIKYKANKGIVVVVRARSLTKPPATQDKARENYNRLNRDLKILIACQFWRHESASTFQSVDKSL